MIAGVGEEELIGRRMALMGLGYPADDWPDDEVVMASGGQFLPSLPGWDGWGGSVARDWAKLHEALPEATRTVAGWAAFNWRHCSNLEILTASIDVSMIPAVMVRAEARAGGERHGEIMTASFRSIRESKGEFLEGLIGEVMYNLWMAIHHHDRRRTWGS